MSSSTGLLKLCMRLSKLRGEHRKMKKEAKDLRARIYNKALEIEKTSLFIEEKVVKNG